MSENEARDERGRWTASGVGSSDAHTHPAGPYMDVSKPENAAKADEIAKMGAAVATKLGYDPSKMNISDESRTFELNGKTLNLAGWATHPPEPKLIANPDGSKTITGQGDPNSGTGTVTLFTPHMGGSQKDMEGVTAHEITHQKFNAFLNDMRSDKLRMEQDPDYHKETRWAAYDPNSIEHERLKMAGAMTSSPQPDGSVKIREPGFMRPDGLLNEPYASKYPAYQSYTNAMMPSYSEFAKSDGVSDYSKEYWLGTHNTVEKEYVKNMDTGEKGTFKTMAVPYETAFHETLAEIGRLKFSGDPVYHKKLGEVEGKPVYFSTAKKGVNPKWAKLYKAMDDNWKRRNKK